MPKRSKEWGLPASLALTAIVIPLIFWLQFGEVGGYAIAFAGFLAILQLAIYYLPKKTGELGESAASKVARGPFDFLCVVWLLCIPFAPFFGWIVTNAFEIDAGNWKILFGIRAGLCVVLPIICLPALLRYVRGPTATILLGVLAIGTTFPVLCGLQSAIDFVHGPKWERVEVRATDDVSFHTLTTQVSVPDAHVHLSDGRTLARSNAGTPLHSGPMQLLVLDASEIILDAK